MGHSFVCGILPAAAQRRLTAARSGMPIQIPGTSRHISRQSIMEISHSAFRRGAAWATLESGAL